MTKHDELIGWLEDTSMSRKNFYLAAGEKCIEAAAAIRELQRINDLWAANSCETWQAMQAMRDSINEHIHMPSAESDLLQGPESSVFCEIVARRVADAIRELRAEADARSEATAQNMADEMIPALVAERDAAVSLYKKAEAQVEVIAASCKSWRKRSEQAECELDALRADNERLRYVLDGVAGAIDTGRNEPLVIWREQIEIAREAMKGASHE